MISLDTPQHKWASYRLGGNLLDFLGSGDIIVVKISDGVVLEFMF